MVQVTCGLTRIDHSNVLDQLYAAYAVDQDTYAMTRTLDEIGYWQGHDTYYHPNVSDQWYAKYAADQETCDLKAIVGEGHKDDELQYLEFTDKFVKLFFAHGLCQNRNIFGL